MLRLITDFDGPIMDVSDRYYRVYQQCLAETQASDQQVHELSKAEFWEMKRARIPETEIGILSGLDAIQATEFAQKRRHTVHTFPYLMYDRPSPGAVETLEKLQRAGVDLVVMTMRRVRELDEAFNRCNLGHFFPEDRRYCLPNDYVKTGDVKDKPLLMAKALAELPPASDTWMVGDTEADIIAAKTHGVKVIGVLCGIRDRSQLEIQQPDLIANNLGEAVEIIFARSAR
ncbi:HAD family hydrolase [Microcoleus sp. EPA2]|uniref:HAD family hydrolase n=1 Tax=Microcoleus sp. EPA2 TaxID=2841654 RepID=UPI00312BC2FB